MREAVLSDIPELVKMGRDFVSLLGIPLGYDDPSVFATLKFLVEDDNGIIFVNEDVSGAIGGFLEPLFFNRNNKSATELFWWVDPGNRGEGLKLLEQFEEWAIANDAYSIQMTCLEWSSPKLLGKLYQKRGYAPTEHHYVRVN